MDTATEEVLTRLGLPRLTIVPLRELERHDPELLAVKQDRTQVEYCWTATPAVCLFALDTNPELAEITYLDADLMFFSDPEVLFDEMGDNATMIVPHRYAPEHRWKEPESGTFNVEWLTFRRDPDGLEALQWWHDQCIEWCYFRVEDGKMGDQKYLDDFPTRFERVHVLEHPGGGLAPWNVTNHELGGTAGSVLVDDRPLVFFHYHSLRLYVPARRRGSQRRSGTSGPAFRLCRSHGPRTMPCHRSSARSCGIRTFVRSAPSWTCCGDSAGRGAARCAARIGRRARRCVRDERSPDE